MSLSLSKVYVYCTRNVGIKVLIYICLNSKPSISLSSRSLSFSIRVAMKRFNPTLPWHRVVCCCHGIKSNSIELVFFLPTCSRRVLGPWGRGTSPPAPSRPRACRSYGCPPPSARKAAHLWFSVNGRIIHSWIIVHMTLSWKQIANPLSLSRKFNVMFNPAKNNLYLSFMI